jgi:endo-1,4-beta-xylanase
MSAKENLWMTGPKKCEFSLANPPKSCLLTPVTRREFLRTGATSTAILFAHPARCAEDETAPPSNAEILADAHASIERHRKGNAIIRVQDADGKPLPGVNLTIEQLRHEFLFGCNCFLFARCANPDQEQEYRQRFAALFNYCTLGFYWAAYEIERGKPNYDYTDQVLEWTKTQGIACKGHPLVWDHPAGSPRWLPDDPAEIAQLVRERIKEIVSRFRGRIDFWDVVNEATHLRDGVNKTTMAAWGAALGPVPYVTEPLRIARAASPSATLLVNDYRTDPPYFQILSRLRDEGHVLIDAVGIQSHMHEGVWPLHKTLRLCDTYAKLGLPIHFTETTILSGSREKSGDAWGPTTPGVEAEQAELAADFYTALFAHPAAQAVTWWDFSDYHAWQRAPAGLLRNDMSPKPVYELLLKLIRRQWWTKAEGLTDDQGTLSLRAFYGRHRVSAEFSPNRKTVGDLQVERGQPNLLTLRI